MTHIRGEGVGLLAPFGAFVLRGGDFDDCGGEGGGVVGGSFGPGYEEGEVVDVIAVDVVTEFIELLCALFGAPTEPFGRIRGKAGGLGGLIGGEGGGAGGSQVNRGGWRGHIEERKAPGAARSSRDGPARG